ncbi:unnamed protein product, partial [Cuscuta campestris]
PNGHLKTALFNHEHRCSKTYCPGLLKANIAVGISDMHVGMLSSASFCTFAGGKKVKMCGCPHVFKRLNGFENGTTGSEYKDSSNFGTYEVRLGGGWIGMGVEERKPGHWKSACPYPKVEKYGERERNEKKKKAMVAAESDESSSSSSDEEALVCMERRAEKSNHEDRWTMSEDDTLCLMAKDDADQELYYNWRAWKVGNSEEQLLDWDQQLKNEKIIKKCLGLPVNHCYEDILDDYWVWQRNNEDLHLEHLATTPVSDFEADDEDTAVYKPVFSKATEDQMAPTSEEIVVLETTAEDFPIFPETSPAFEMVLTETDQEKAASPPQEQNQEATEEEEFQRLIQSQVLEILTTPCEISNQTQLEILEKSAKIPEQSAIPEIMEKEVEVQRHSGKAEKESQMAEEEVTNFHFHSSSIPTLLDEIPETWTKKVQGLIESALASQHASFRQEIELMEAKHTELIEKSEEKHSADLKEISKSVEKTLEIISLLSKTVSNTMEIYTSDSQLQFNEFNKVKEQIANVTVSLQKQMSLLQMDIRSALAIASANQVVTKDYLKVIIDNQKEAYKLFRLIGAHSGNRKMEVILQQHSPSPIPQLPIAVNEGEASYVPSHLNMTNLILEAQQRNPENSAQHLSSSGLDGTEFIGAVADHFSDAAQSEERRENLRRIKELCGNMQGLSEVAGSSKRKRN